VSVLRTAFLSCVLCACVCSGASYGEDYPAKPVRLVVPLSPGGPADTIARLVATRLSEKLGQTVVVDNRAGGSTIIGTEIVAHALPDGYTLLMITTTHAINPGVFRKLPFDMVKDFAPITMTATAPFVLVVQPQMQAKTVKELIALAQKRPGELNYGTSGAGSSMHLTAELFSSVAKISMTHVPYKGAGPALTDLLAGHIQVVFSSAVASLPHVTSGRLRGIAVTSLKRIAAAPSLPTVAEAGFAGFESSSWNGVMTPARTPRPVVDRLNKEIAAVLAMPAVRENLAREGAEPGGDAPAAFGAYLQSEIVKWAAVTKRIGVKPE
jgi:tripartite-type tricarboxylate transporter receptor subunit TctC